METNIEHLKQVFHDFEPDLIQDIMDNVIVKEVNSGEIVIRTGQHLSSAMILLNGTLKIYREGDEGSEFFLYFIPMFEFGLGFELEKQALHIKA